MTTIVAKRLTNKPGIIFACDDQVTYGSMRKSIDTKIIVKDSVIFGFAGSVRDFNLIKHSLTVPKFGKSAKENPERWVVNKLIPAIKKVLEDGGNLETQHGQSSSDSVLIVSVPGLCGYIGQNFSLTGIDEPYWSVGSGSEFAFGALACGATAEDAVSVAGMFDIYTGDLSGSVKVRW